MKLIFSLFLLLTSFWLQAQEIQETLDKKTQRKMQRKERKQLREEELAEQKEYIEALVRARKFVLEADNLSGRTGSPIPVNSTLNFLAVDSTKAIIQIGSVSGIGYNGVGGITDEGRVTRYEVTENKNNFGVKIFVQGQLTSYTIFLNASYGTRSTARVTGLSGGVINYHGPLVATEESRVFKGMSVY